MQPSAADQANQQMVDRLIAEGALWSPRLIAAFRSTPRHHFLDRVYQYHRKQERWREVVTCNPRPEHLRIVYSDRALITRLSRPSHDRPEMPISSSSQPSLMAQMLEDLKLGPGLKVLEVGAGTGYNAALLAHAVGPGQVVSVDVDRDVLAEAWDHLRGYPERDIQLKHADGRYGDAEGAPFDRIMVTAATPDLEPAWLEQLADRGLLLAPLVLAPGLAYVVRGTVTDGAFHGRLTRAAYFMALRAEDEVGSSDAGPPPPAGELRALPAPWAGWFDRRPARATWLGFIQSVAFYGWLRGLTIHYRTLSDGQPVYGVNDGEALGWLGPQDWHVNGDAGRDLGWGLWRAYLDAGGPWPTEFRLRAGPDVPRRSAGRREEYMRKGPRSYQLWELTEPRDRPARI
jgi:protein-L-isoaspartate(D-aspartate) O-methyltransferase